MRRELYDKLWELSPSRFVFAVITTFWSVLLLSESDLRVLLAIVLPTGPFLAASPALATTMFGGGDALTIWFSTTAIKRGKAIVETGLPEAGTSWSWWVRQYLAPSRYPPQIRNPPSTFLAHAASRTQRNGPDPCGDRPNHLSHMSARTCRSRPPPIAG